MENLQNIIYVIVDDLRPDFGFAHSSSLRHQHHTPTFDRLAAESTYFSMAFAQVAFCVPSRASFLTGLRPETTGSVHNDQLVRFDNHRLAPLQPGTTVFDYFKRAGYTTAAVGKIFHHGESHPSIDLPILQPTHDLLGRPCDSAIAKDVQVPHSRDQFGFPKACNLPFGYFVDEKVAAGAIRYLRMLSQSRGRSGQSTASGDILAPPPPFLLMIGFSRPHNPYQFPSRHLDALPWANSTDVATVRFRHESQPAIAFADTPECTQRKCSREQRRYYRAAVSHMDEMLGLVLKEERKLALANNTLLVLHADHGISLGENGAWEKRTVFDHATRVPLFIRDAMRPASHGRRVTQSLVELTDVLPTLIELSGAHHRVKAQPQLQGKSLRPLLDPTPRLRMQGGIRPSTSMLFRAFRYSYSIAPRLLYVAHVKKRDAGATDLPLLVDGGAAPELFVAGRSNRSSSGGYSNESPGAGRRSRDAGTHCSDQLAPSPFGPGRPCRFVAMGFSVRSLGWRYTRWERWPSKPGSRGAQPKGSTAKRLRERIWTVGEGELLAEELYRYNDSTAHDETPFLAASGGEFEQINHLAPSRAKTGSLGLGATRPSLMAVRQIKDQLMTALLSRKPPAEVREIKSEM